jgi:pimeloyl-ACP methyl ester carboxylesterase
MAVSFFQTGGVKLAAHESGTGLPMIFQHGLCGDAGQTAQVFPSGAGYRRITVECRGHGLSDVGAFDDFSIAAFANDVLRYMDEAGIETPVIGGISMGAAIALRLAVQNPGRFKGLVLARPAWLLESEPENMFPNAIAGNLIEHFSPLKGATMFEGSDVASMLAKEGPDNLNSIRNFFARRPRAATAQLLQRISADGPGVSEADIRRIAIPALVIGNELDYVHPIAYAKTLAGWISGARFVEVTSKAKNPSRYQSDFSAALAAFLKEF